MREKARSLAISLAIALSVFIGMRLLSEGALFVRSCRRCAGGLEKEFEDICSKTQDSMSFSAG